MYIYVGQVCPQSSYPSKWSHFSEHCTESLVCACLKIKDVKSWIWPIRTQLYQLDIVATELKDPIWHSSEWQIGSFSSEATKYIFHIRANKWENILSLVIFLKWWRYLWSPKRPFDEYKAPFPHKSPNIITGVQFSSCISKRGSYYRQCVI